MPNYQAITRERHAQQYWRRSPNCTFAAAETVAPLSVSEMPKAAMSLPIGFITQSDTFTPVAVLGLLPGKNLFVAADASWSAPYIPATFRTYPFRLGQTETGEQVLCIDEDSGLLNDASQGERFFGDDGQAAPAVLEALNFLSQNEQHRLATVAACAALQKHQLIRPWPITLKTEAGEQKVEGLFQVDEAAFNQLTVAALHEVREAGAFPLVFCQLLSMQHLQVLSQLNDTHAKAAAQAAQAHQQAQSRDLNLDFLSQGGTLKFV